MYKHSHSDHMELQRPDQSLNADWRKQTGLLFEAGCEGGRDEICLGVLHLVAHLMWREGKTYARTSGGRIRLRAADGLDHSLETQIKSAVA